MYFRIKRKQIVVTAILVYIIAMLFMYNKVDSYIESKRWRLYWELEDSLTKIFEDGPIMGLHYYDNPVEYEEIDIPHSKIKYCKRFCSNTSEDNDGFIGLDEDFSEKDSLLRKHQNFYEEWKIYENLYKAYQLDSENGNDRWCLRVCKLKDYKSGSHCITNYFIYPFTVGYTDKNYMPKIESVLDEALEFCTTDKEYRSLGKYVENIDSLLDKIRLDLRNEYFWFTWETDSTIEQQIKNDSVMFYTWKKIGACVNCRNIESFHLDNIISSDYSWTFLTRKESSKVLCIEEDKWIVELERKELLLSWTKNLTIVLLFIVIPVCVIELRQRKLKKETLYDRLKRLCKPSNFVKRKKYDKEKVTKANIIYKRLLEINKDDIEALNELQQQAVDELHINLINAETLMDLKEKVNPKRYMKPYNSDKVELANELFTILNKKELTYNEMKEVEERAKALSSTTSPVTNMEDNSNSQQQL